MDGFTRVIDVGELPDPGKTLVEVDGEMIALFHVGDAWYALDDVCTHDGGPLADGELRDHKISCPRHGAKFDIRTGAALTMPAVRPTRSHEVRVADGGVWVRLREAPLDQGPATLSQPAAGPATAAPAAANAAAEATTATPASQPPSPAPAATGPLCEDTARELLKEVKDPELFVNIVDLGLIYGVTITPAEADASKQHVAIDMTMTSPACPAGPQLIADTKRVLSQRPDVAAVEVRIVMEPPWTPDRMTEAARDQLGIF